MNEQTICFSKTDFEEMQPDIWLDQMKQRGKDCLIKESENPLPSIQRWKAHCTDAQGTPHDYEFSVSLPGLQPNRLSISGKITDEAGKSILANAFLGEYKGDCQSGMHKFIIWDYFDLPDRRVMESVARDLLYCGAIYAGIAPKLKQPKRAEILDIGLLLTASAADVLPDDPTFLTQELVSASERAVSEIIGADMEKMLQLIQSPECQPYLKPKGISAVISERNAALSVD
jgi:hypothetical protein